MHDDDDMNETTEPKKARPKKARPKKEPYWDDRLPLDTPDDVVRGVEEVLDAVRNRRLSAQDGANIGKLLAVASGAVAARERTRAIRDATKGGPPVRPAGQALGPFAAAKMLPAPDEPVRRMPEQPPQRARVLVAPTLKDADE